MADYEHDIFISYRRMDKDWIRWTSENLLRPLRSLLRPALGNVGIFLDDQIETGASWPAYLASAHARSLGEAEPLMRRVVEILIQFTLATGHEHPHLQTATGNYKSLLKEMGQSEQEVEAQLIALGCRLTGDRPSSSTGVPPNCSTDLVE